MIDWPEIVRTYSPVVWSTAIRLLRSSADAEDCLQATFISAWQLSQTQDIQSWPGLLKQLATRRALELLRQQCRYADRVSSADVQRLMDRNGQPPEAAAAANELAERLRLALAWLEPRQAEVFCLAGLEGMSYSEIAQRLSLSTNHVGVLLNRARTVLRQHFVDAEVAAANDLTKETKA